MQEKNKSPSHQPPNSYNYTFFYVFFQTYVCVCINFFYTHSSTMSMFFCIFLFSFIISCSFSLPVRQPVELPYSLFKRCITIWLYGYTIIYLTRSTSMDPFWLWCCKHNEYRYAHLIIVQEHFRDKFQKVDILSQMEHTFKISVVFICSFFPKIHCKFLSSSVPGMVH